MTITIGIPPFTMPADLTEGLRGLLPLVEPIALAIASACGAGLLVQLGLGTMLRLIQRALAE